jgi:hypothetical protein
MICVDRRLRIAGRGEHTDTTFASTGRVEPGFKRSKYGQKTVAKPKGKDTKALSFSYSGVVQLVARQPLELVILVRVQAPEPFFYVAGSPSRTHRLL